MSATDTSTAPTEEWSDEHKEQTLKSFADAPLDLAYAVLEHSGIKDLVLQRTQKALGRPQCGLSAVDVLAAAIAAPLKNGSPQFQEMARLLHQEMPAEQRKQRGITRPWPTPEHSAAQRRRMIRTAEEAVRRRFESLVRSFDAYTGPRNQKMDLATLIEQAQVAHAADPDGTLAAGRRSDLLDVMNGLVHGTLNLVPSDLLAQMGNVFAIDGTFVPTWARGLRKHTPYKKTLREVTASTGDRQALLKKLRRDPHSIVSADPEAGWYVRTNADGSLEEKGFGYDAHLAVALNPTADTNSVTFPSMVVGMTLDTPAFDPGQNAIAIIERMQRWAGEQQRSPFEIGVFDALYPRLSLTDFRQPLLELGIKKVARLREDGLGKSGVTYEGTMMVEGTLYCAEMPKRLVDANKNHLNGQISEDEHQRLIRDRERWQMYSITGDDVLDAQGRPRSHRYECPASQRGGCVSCVRKPQQAGPVALPLPVRALPKDAPVPGACGQRSITVPRSVAMGTEQAVPYMSEEWKEYNGRFRSANEGKNGALKDPSKIGIASKGRRRVNGLAANGLLLACQVAAGNLQRLATFLQDTDATETGVRTRNYSGYRTRRAAQKSIDRPLTSTREGARRSKRKIASATPAVPRARSARTAR